MRSQREQLENFLTGDGQPLPSWFTQCRAEKELCEIDDGEHDFLVCDIQQDAHAGLNHHDPIYGIWWSACDLPEHGHGKATA